MPKVKIKDLTVTYTYEKEKIKAIDKLSLEIPENRITVIIGPSGCGKTTLLKSILGLLKIDSGDIFFEGENLKNLTPQKRNFAYISQNIVLYPHLTIFDNIALPLKEQKVNPTIIYKKINEISKIFEIEKLLSRKPNQLSIGQQQRIQLAKALVKESRLYLFDEPFANLDEATRQMLRRYLKCCQEEFGLTVIFITHKIEEAMSLADKLVIMNNGIIVEEGDPQDIYDYSTSEVFQELRNINRN